MSYFAPVSRDLLLGRKKKNGGECFFLANGDLIQTEKAQLIRSLQTHKVNTLTELRRIEKIFEGASSAETVEPMNSAWSHYVNSNQLLSELRSLTKNYPFSSECLDEAKWRVVEDSANNRSRNYCWLVLSKIRKEYVTFLSHLFFSSFPCDFSDFFFLSAFLFFFNSGLIAKHARTLAAKPAMWGGRTPTAAGVEKLAIACVAEWTRALDQMLRNWASPPVRQ